MKFPHLKLKSACGERLALAPSEVGRHVEQGIIQCRKYAVIQLDHDGGVLWPVPYTVCLHSVVSRL